MADARRRLATDVMGLDGDGAWLAQAASDPDAQFVLVADDKGASVQGALATGAPDAEAMAGEHIFLGTLGAEGPAVFVAEAACSRGELDAPEASLVALGRQLVVWRRSARHCGHCGAPTKPRKGGWAMTCTDRERCGASVYPRVDPSIIAIVKSACEEWILLGHNAAWEAGRFALIAGFVEPGEALEDCVAREVEEESAVVVDPASIEYSCSQPWPFPQSYMVGFTARTVGGDDGAAAPGCPSWPPPPPRAADGELLDARWFHRDWLRTHGGVGVPNPTADGARWDARGFHFPGGYSLARRMLEAELSRPAPSGPLAAWAGPALDFARLGEGKQKFVLLSVQDERGVARAALFGDPRAAYHADIFEREGSRLRGAGAAAVECLGGAFAELDAASGRLRVYGDSARFGPADESAVRALLAAGYPMFDVVVEAAPAFEGADRSA
eukprot:PRCOL_00006603-RA